MVNAIELFLATVVALIPIANPVSTAALFLGITQGDDPIWRQQQAKMGCVYMFFILVGFLLAGSIIMELFGISIPGIRIAGGLMVARVALGMLRPSSEGLTPESHEEARTKSDISFTPLAMPSLSGPGAIAVTIGLATEIDHAIDYAVIIVGIFVVALTCWAVLRASTLVVRFFGVAGMNALSRIMGFLLLCVGIQFILNGLIGVFTDPDILNQVQAALSA